MLIALVLGIFVISSIGASKRNHSESDSSRPPASIGEHIAAVVGIIVLGVVALFVLWCIQFNNNMNNLNF